MRYLVFSGTELTSYPICVLVPRIQRDEIQKAYIEPFGLLPDEILVMDLHLSTDSKVTPKAEMVQYIQEELGPVLSDMGVKYVLCTEAGYFKTLTGAAKVDTHLGYVMDSLYGPQKVIYLPSHKLIWRDPEKVKAKISQGITALLDHRQDTYFKPGTGIIQHESYPRTYEEIELALERLLEMDCDLAIDIEAFSLKHYEAGIGTITFCWNQHEGIAFAVDYVPIVGATTAPYGEAKVNHPVRGLLKSFFERFRRKAIYHKIDYDVCVLIYQLFMRDILDTEGLLAGMEVMLRNWDCTRLISYLATNTCAGNKLSLKELAQKFAGNYAMGENITDIRKIPLDQLLRYNLVDGLSTWFTRDKHLPRMIRDQQLHIYETLFKPAMLDIVQMQLTGLPVNMDKVIIARAKLEVEEDKAIQRLMASSLVHQFVDRMHHAWAVEKNGTLKKKRVTAADCKLKFNPKSGPQVQELIYEMLGLPVLARSDTGLPSTKAEHLEDLKNHTTNSEVLELLQALLDFAAVRNFLSTFIPAFEGAVLGPDGWHYLFGSFNLGGTLSGRLSSSDPNLQNLPAGADPSTAKGLYGKWIKECVEAPPGWIFAGLDFASLEDRISALTTRDPNKLKVYTDGYDGHSLRAFAYYPEEMPDIDPGSVESINSIQKKYKPQRARSKNPTFTLTYQGTWNTLVVKYKFTEELAKLVEARYHELYKVSDEWVAAKLDQACIDGYVTVAFGLRVRTPLLQQVVRGNSKTPAEAEAEGRSAGNALGQSWCLLNSRAASEFMGKVRKSEHRLAIRPCAQIHDAQYYMLRDDVSVVHFTNEHLVEAVKWQDDPEIYHPDVGLGGELSLFWPNWAREIGIPNGSTEDDIVTLIEKALTE